MITGEGTNRHGDYERQDSRLAWRCGMRRDPKKFREIARVCAVLSKSAVTPEEHDTFATLAET